MSENVINNTHYVLKIDIKEQSLKKFHAYDELNEEIGDVINKFFKSKGVESELISSYYFYPGSIYMPDAVRCHRCNQWLLKKTGSSAGCVYEIAIAGSAEEFYCDYCLHERSELSNEA